MVFEKNKTEKLLAETAQKEMPKEMTKEEKKEIVREFLNTGYIESPFPVIEKLDCRRLENVFGKERLQFVCRAILERNGLKEEMKKNGFNERKVSGFIKRRGYSAVPYRFYQADHILSDAKHSLNKILRYGERMMDASGIRDIDDPKAAELKSMYPGWIDKIIEDMETRTLPDIKRETKEWEAYADFDPSKEKKKIVIEEFENLDLSDSNISAEEIKKIIEKAVEILPGGGYSAKIGKIIYKGELKNDEFGLGEYKKCCGTYSMADEGEKMDKIFIQKVKGVSIGNFLTELPRALLHEYLHSFDPRLSDRKELSPAKQFKIIEKWENVRKKEDVDITQYVETETDAFTKSVEDWADSGADAIIRPLYVKGLSQERFDFFDRELKKYFPDFILPEIRKRKDEYYDFVLPLLKKEKQR